MLIYLGAAVIIIGIKKFANTVDLQRINTNYKNKKMALDKMQFILTRDDIELIVEGWN